MKTIPAREQILAIPDTRAVTVKSGGIALRHDPKDRFKPFLPADLYSKESSWICFGEDYSSIPAHIHSPKLKWRSAFLQFMRVPGGRTETLKYLEKLKKRKKVFPVGTQFALIEQAFLISKDGELILSPLIVSISLRAYLDVNREAPYLVNRSARDARLLATQCVAEFVMQPRQLMQGNAVMKAMNPRDYRFETAEGLFPPGEDDPSETGTMPDHTRLNRCMRCHGAAGAKSIGTIGFRHRLFLKEGSPEAISKATSTRKRDDGTWKTLRGLWRTGSKKRGTQSISAYAIRSDSARWPGNA